MLIIDNYVNYFIILFGESGLFRGLLVQSYTAPRVHVKLLNWHVSSRHGNPKVDKIHMRRFLDRDKGEIKI